MHEILKDEISESAHENIEYLKNLFSDNADVILREFYMGRYNAGIAYIDGMSDKILLDNFVLETLMDPNTDIKNIKDDTEEIKRKILTVSDVKSAAKFGDCINLMLSGEALLFIDGLSECYVIAARAFPARGVSEPASETVIRGARDSFTETIRFNTVLIRRRIRDTRLKMVPKTIGVRSKTDVIVTYIEDIVNKDVLSELQKRLKSINVDAILDSGYIEEYIEDDTWSLFPQVQSTERPDVVAAALYEGRIAVIVDNSPYAIIVPATFPSFFQSPDDYYGRWIYSSFIRILRFIGLFIALIAPAFYVAVTSFHTSIIPSKLAYSIAATREGVPFPAFVEALIMEISLDFLTEASIRLPKPISATIGIVGGLIIGQAAVSAGIVSPVMIIVVAITVICSFITSNYEINIAIRIIRFLLIIAASILGLYGIMLGLITALIHLVRLKSFGIPYLSPAVNPDISDFKDMFIRFPHYCMKERPHFMKTGDKIRQK